MRTTTTLILAAVAPLVLAHPSPLAARQSAPDYSNWQPAGPNDSRSPCPMLNTLANHNFIPHSGRGITYDQVRNAFSSALNVGDSVSFALFRGAQALGLGDADGTLDLVRLREHNKIEHDGSLSRADFASGNDYSFNKTIFDSYMAYYGDAETVGPDQTSRARKARVEDARSKNPQFVYGPAQAFGSYGETSLMTGVLGSVSTGEVKPKYIRSFFENERLPYKEGWRHPANSVSITDVNKLILKLKVSSGESLSDVASGTLSALEDAMANLKGHFGAKA